MTILVSTVLAVIAPSFVEELRTGDDRFHQAAEAMVIISELVTHVLNRRLI